MHVNRTSARFFNTSWSIPLRTLTVLVYLQGVRCRTLQRQQKDNITTFLLIKFTTLTLTITLTLTLTLTP